MGQLTNQLIVTCRIHVVCCFLDLVKSPQLPLGKSTRVEAVALALLEGRVTGSTGLKDHSCYWKHLETNTADIPSSSTYNLMMVIQSDLQFDPSTFVMLWPFPRSPGRTLAHPFGPPEAALPTFPLRSFLESCGSHGMIVGSIGSRV